MIPKFRAWLKQYKKMVDEVNDMTFFEGNLEFIGCRPADGVSFQYCADDIILMQSTGSHDKNGKEIFEGDIVKRDGIKRPEVVRFGEWIDVDTLGFEEQYIGFYFESEHEGQKRLYSVESQFNNLSKVIGNIYENQELLEEEE